MHSPHPCWPHDPLVATSLKPCQGFMLFDLEKPSSFFLARAGEGCDFALHLDFSGDSQLSCGLWFSSTSQLSAIVRSLLCCIDAARPLRSTHDANHLTLSCPFAFSVNDSFTALFSPGSKFNCLARVLLSVVHENLPSNSAVGSFVGDITHRILHCKIRRSTQLYFNPGKDGRDEV